MWNLCDMQILCCCFIDIMSQCVYCLQMTCMGYYTQKVCTDHRLTMEIKISVAINTFGLSINLMKRAKSTMH